MALHKLLARQLHAARCADGTIDLDVLCGIIDEAYEELDRERRLNDRAAKLMEDELMAANEQAKREHSAVLATILASAPDGMLVAAPNGNIETANAEAERQFHAAPGALIGCNLEKLLLLDGDATRDRCEVEPGNRHIGETSALTLQGESFPVEYSISTLGTGGAVRRLWIVRDITERIRFQHEIVESRMRFQDFAEASSDCLWELNQDLTNVQVTSSENSENAIHVANLLEQIPAGQPPAGVSAGNWRCLQEKISAGKPFRDVCFSTFRKNEQKLDIMLSGKPVKDATGVFKGYRGTARDISQEIVARDSAKRAQRRMIGAMNAAPSAITLIDAAMNFVAGNSALSALAPSAADKLQHGNSFPEYLEYALANDGALKDGTPPAKLAHKLLRSGKPHEIRLNGKWLLVASRSMSDHGAVLTFSDITEIKERERELAEAKKSAESANLLKSQFLATMSHELRTPLNAILGFSEVIRDQIFGNGADCWEKYADYASSIHVSGRHLLDVISEILDLSKIEAGSYTLDRQTIDFRPILAEAISILQPAAQRAGVAIHTSLPSERVDIFADERAIFQIVLNLLSNATKFTARDGRVDVTLSTTGDYACLVVEDTGIGIDPADQEAVFEPFTQVDASVQRRHEGTGLGLAITKRLVEMHDGSIGLQSELGTGTRLEITLPTRMGKSTGARSSAEVAA